MENKLFSLAAVDIDAAMNNILSAVLLLLVHVWAVSLYRRSSFWDVFFDMDAFFVEGSPSRRSPL